MDKPTVREVILVEGRYDKNTLSQVVDALILETNGFAIFKDKEKAALFRRLAAERGVILLTDSDGGGLVIRNHLKSILPPGQVKEAFIPDRPGKERRKRAPGKEGKLGVEGMDPTTLLSALRRAGATFQDTPPSERPAAITKTTLYALGLAGTPDAAARRAALLDRLDLPRQLTANRLVAVLNALYTPEELTRLLAQPASPSPGN